jgi:hypothetical protein
MPDTMTIVADTLRTLMGATAADPYIKAIEKAVAEREPAADTYAIIQPLIDKLGDCMDHDNARVFVVEVISDVLELKPLSPD